MEIGYEMVSEAHVRQLIVSLYRQSNLQAIMCSWYKCGKHERATYV